MGEAGPVSDTQALLLLEGVLARGVISTRTVIHEHCLLSMQVMVLLELLASAAAVVTDLRLEVVQEAVQGLRQELVRAGALGVLAAS